ncbi:hypothetical protein [Caballeronia glebae]|uniref:hypothetical protein n=1 Tax=Caballeronia glebae TaxID=1777143 RepID=UPI0038B78942
MSKIYDPTVSVPWTDTDDLPKTYAYNGDGTLSTETCTDGTRVWVKTYSYTVGKLTGESAWVKQ